MSEFAPLITAIATPGRVKLRHSYDHFGRIVQKCEDGVATQYAQGP